jgi:hypothetical protein
MAHFGAKLVRKKEAAILALMTQGTIEKAAEAARIGVRTLYRWLRMPEFREALHQAKHEAFSQATTRLQQNSVGMATVLLRLALDPDTPPSVRVHAADRALTHARKGTEIEATKAGREAEHRTDSTVRLQIELPGILPGTVEGAVVCYREDPAGPLQVIAVQNSDHLHELFETAENKALPRADNRVWAGLPNDV